MNAELKRVTPADIWTTWENRVVNGIFPLRRFIGGSDHSAVFLTEFKAQNIANAAIKFMPAHPRRAEAQLVQWGAAATVSHPHLLRLFDMGRCQFDGHGFLYVVMEYADQTLAQVLPKRALSPDEACEMLGPVLQTLTYLHRNHLVQGQLKPSNVLVVGDRLKLASDAIRPTEESATPPLRHTLYDPPELREGTITTAGDIWALGMTLFETLTQRTPSWPDERRATAAPPGNIPEPFADTIRKCLSRTPSNRPTAEELEAQYKPLVPAAAAPTPAEETARETAATSNAAKPHPLLMALGILGALTLFLIAWVALRSPQTFATFGSAPQASESNASSAGSTAGTEAPIAWEVAKMPEPNAELPSTMPELPPETVVPPADSTAGVVLQIVPEVPAKTLRTLRGSVRVTVRVLVDPTGNVVGDLLEARGPSRYFAREARQSAVGWKFVPSDNTDSRVWLLRFTFTRDGVTTKAESVR